MRKVIWLALIALALLGGAARAETSVVKTVDWCTSCDKGNLGVGFQGDDGSVVTVKASGLIFDAKSSVWRGGGSFEVKDAAGVPIRFDNFATFAVGLIDAPGVDGCSGKAISLLIVHGQDPASGHYTLIAYPENCKVGNEGMCAESRVAATLDTTADADDALAAEVAMLGAKARASNWGRIKFQYAK